MTLKSEDKKALSDIRITKAYNSWRMPELTTMRADTRPL